MVFLCRSMCVHSSFGISPIRAPVSLSSCKSVAVLGEPAEIRLSISCSVGMNGSPCSLVYFGCIHVLPKYLR